ncbi:sodium-dependent transporter [Parvularcula oceani]|uniref:sodium-dependent transporter n=1 Tax=Parvularcula oceani TaxID=1247963 RepID=UPI0006911AB9|nr:sodium-dependent transporter [Parvularcula oceani]
MATVAADNQEHWSGKAAFIFAAVGSAVGLGNLWRFPYQAGENGGGAFVIVYVLCVLAIGLPVLAAELFLGRRGGGSAVAAIRRLANAEGTSGAWTVFAWVGMLASFLIVTFYSVIAGWVLYFALVMVGDLFSGMGDQGIAALTGGAFYGVEQAEIEGQLGELTRSPWTMILFHAIFMGLTTWIVSRGIKGGIEAAVKILMPAFFVLLVLLSIFAMIRGDAGAAFAFLFQPDFETLVERFADGSILLSAIGQAFFSLSLGSALMITYGLYIGRDQSIPESASIVAVSDTAVALIAGLAIFPIVFQFGLTPGAGPGLMFGTLPLGFSQMPFGSIFGIAFFLMAFFAALTSSISLLEVATAWADGDVDLSPEERKHKRRIGALVLGLIAFVIGVAHALSVVPASEGNFFFNTWHPADGLPLFEGDTLLDFTDKLTGSVLLPFGGLMTALFAGWAVSSTASREELGFSSDGWYRAWRFLVRWVCPILVGLVLVWGAFVSPIIAARQAPAQSEAADVIEEMARPQG